MKKKLYFFLILSALLTTSTLSAQDATTGLKLHYTFDDGTATDVSGHNLTGSFVGLAASVAGKFGQAVSMTTKSDYVTLPNDVTLGLIDYSVTAWAKLNTLNQWGRIFDFGSSTSNYMFLSPSNGSIVRYAILVNGTGEQGINGPVIPVGQWVHYAVTCAFDPGTGIGVAKLYVDGVLVGTNETMTDTPDALGSTTQNYLGLSQWANDATLNGSVDDVRIYSRALTQGDIQTVAGYDKIATLDTIIIPDAVFTPSFASGTFIYNVLLPVGTESIVPELTFSVLGSTVTGDGAVDVSSGSGVATIVVTSIDGSATKTYTLNYTVLGLSNDTKLSGLQVSEGVLEPAFSETVYNYIVNLPISTMSVAVGATPRDVLSTVAGDGDIALDQDGGKATIIVTAEDGTTKTTTITFIKGEATYMITNPSFETHNYDGWTWTGRTGGWQDVNTDVDNTKDGKYIAGHWNSPIADLECYQTLYGVPEGYYQVTVGYTVPNNRLSNQRLFANNKSMLYGASTATAYSAANLAILGATEIYTFGGYATSNKENGPLKKLSVVEHVTADTLRIGIKLSGKATTLGYDYSYTTQGDLGFSKWDNFRLTNVSKKASLDNISVTDGAFDVPFASGTYSYNVSLAKGTVTVDPAIKLSFDGTPVTGDGAVDVSSGSGTSSIVVTSLDGTAQRTYTINYTVRTISNDARLSALTLSAGTFVPSFSPDVYSYKVVVPQHTPSITVSATAKDNSSTFTGAGVITLDNSNGIDSIVVTAEDGTSMKKYMIKFERDNATFFKVTTAPTIDGVISENDQYASNQWNDQKATIGINTGGSSSKFQIVHDDANIYIAVQVIDTTNHVEAGIANDYERDCIEFYFSMNPALTSNTTGVTSYRVQRDGLKITGGGFANLDSMILAGVQFGVFSDANGWVVEAKFPLDSLVKTAVFDGVHFKFEAKTADNTTGATGGRTYQMAWKDNSDSQWQGPNTFAACVLSPDAVVPDAIKNVSNNASSVYLDRATKTLHVASAANQVQIYDLRGSLVRSVTLNGKTSVNVSNLQSGVYIVKCGKDVSKIVL